MSLKKPKINGDVEQKQKIDRLSSLHDDILIGILTHLPINTAIVSGSLSHRWHGLWTNVTSIQISNQKFKCLTEFSPIFDNIMLQIKSPVMDSFNVELDRFPEIMNWEPSVYSWLRQLRDRNVRTLKITWPNFDCGDRCDALILPRVFYQTWSLVSIELFCSGELELPDEDVPFDLPNLKNLSLRCMRSRGKWLEKLIQTCPSLEKLFLGCADYWNLGSKIKCSNHNLRSLTIKVFMSQRIEISSPKLEYLLVCAPKLTTVRFIEEPILLREAKIITMGDDETPSEYLKKLISKFYEAISNVRFLSLDILELGNISTVFRNVTHLRLNMKTSHNNMTVLSVLGLCPVLNVLTLQFIDISVEQWIFPKLCLESNSSHRALKRIEIETKKHSYCKLSPCLLDLVGFLVSEATDLEHFMFTVVNDDTSTDKESVVCKHRRERKLCKVLYDNLVVFMKTEFAFEFEGRIFKTSRKVRSCFESKGKARLIKHVGSTSYKMSYPSG